MSRLWLLAGPPFGGELFRASLPRIVSSRPDVATEVVSVVEEARGGGWPESAASLAERVTTEDVVVAHGLAVPVALALAARCEAAGRPLAALGLANGPLVRLDVAAAAVVRVASVPGAAQTFLRPTLWLTWLRSSVGLRRAVNNPYAMDHDTVAALCGALVADSARRVALATWLRSLRTPWPEPASFGMALTLLWGDNDRLHPLGEADQTCSTRLGVRVDVAPGGRFAWPEELPWHFADSVVALLPRPRALAAAESPTTTRMSRVGGPGRPRAARDPHKEKVGR